MSKNIRYISKRTQITPFANLFTVNEIGAPPVGQIPWSTIITIIEKSSFKEEMVWYINQAYENRWCKPNILSGIRRQSAFAQPFLKRIVQQELACQTDRSDGGLQFVGDVVDHVFPKTIDFAGSEKDGKETDETQQD